MTSWIWPLDGVALAQRAGYEVALRAGDVTNELLSVEPSRVQSLRHLDQLRHQGLQVARAVARRAATLATEPDAPQFTQFLVAVNRARDALEQIDASVARSARKERMVRALDVAALTVGMGTAVAGIAASAGAGHWSHRAHGRRACGGAWRASRNLCRRVRGGRGRCGDGRTRIRCGILWARRVVPKASFETIRSTRCRRARRPPRLLGSMIAAENGSVMFNSFRISEITIHCGAQDQH